MKILVTTTGDTELLEVLKDRAQMYSAHELVDDPEAAELILLAGSFGRDPGFVLDHPLYKKFPDKCAVYTEDDNYLPLLPGVYCSAHRDLHSQAGRIFSYTYVSRNGKYSNRFLAEGEAASRSSEGAIAAKKYLFSFQGGSTSLLRKRLFNIKFGREDVLVENTSSYYHWDNSQPDRVDRQRHYADTLMASHFVVCPRGAGVGSIRFFEVMAAGIAPVLLSDEYALPPDIDWDSFLIRIPEKDFRRLPGLLESYLPTAAERGRKARKVFLAEFARGVEFDRVVALARRSLSHSAPSEDYFRKLQGGMIRRRQRRERLRSIARSAFMGALKLLRLRNPYQMNR